MWKIIGIKNQKDLSILSSQTPYKRIHQIDSNFQKEFSTSGSPINNLKKNVIYTMSQNSEKKFDSFVPLSKIHNVNCDKINENISIKNILERNTYHDVERKRDINVQNLNNNKSEQLSLVKNVNNQLGQIELLNQNSPQIEKHGQSNIINQVIRKKSMINKSNKQSQKKLLMNLIQQIIPNTDFNEKLGIQIRVSDNKQAQVKQRYQYTIQLQQKVKKLSKIQKIYQQELIKLRNFQMQLLQFTMKELQKYSDILEKFQKQTIFLIYLQPTKYKEIETREKQFQQQIQLKIKKIKERQKQLSDQKQMLQIKMIDINKQYENMNLKLIDLSRRQQIINQYQQIIITQQDLKQKKKNIQQQQFGLLNRLKQLQAKQDILLIKEKGIQKKKISRIKSNEQDGKIIQDKNIESSQQQRKQKLYKLKSLSNLQISTNNQKKQQFETVNSLLNRITAMKNNLDQISGYNQKFSRTLQKSRSHNVLLNNLVKIEKGKLIQ